MEAFKINNYRQIKVKFLPPTNYSGSRIKIYEPKRYSDDKTEYKIFSYCYETGDIMQQAYKILKSSGFNVAARASEHENHIFLCDNWGDNFLHVKNLK